MELTNDELESLDPCPEIHSLYAYYNDLYFDNALGACSVEWSTSRMTLCAGVCHYERGGGCRIKLSEPLLKFRPTKDLKETLLHEMIHAYIFLERIRDNDSHGTKFQEKMRYINDATFPDHQRPPGGYNITIYHTMHDEVNNYRQHWWKCGKCENVVKRAMNRPPQEADCRARQGPACLDPRCLWHTHVRFCGGDYQKIKEPEDYGKAKAKRRKASMAADSAAEGSAEPSTSGTAAPGPGAQDASGSGKAPQSTKITNFFHKTAVESKDATTTARPPPLPSAAPPRQQPPPLPRSTPQAQTSRGPTPPPLPASRPPDTKHLPRAPGSATPTQPAAAAAADHGSTALLASGSGAWHSRRGQPTSSAQADQPRNTMLQTPPANSSGTMAGISHPASDELVASPSRSATIAPPAASSMEADATDPAALRRQCMEAALRRAGRAGDPASGQHGTAVQPQPGSAGALSAPDSDVVGLPGSVSRTAALTSNPASNPQRAEALPKRSSALSKEHAAGCHADLDPWQGSGGHALERKRRQLVGGARAEDEQPEVVIIDLLDSPPDSAPSPEAALPDMIDNLPGSSAPAGLARLPNMHHGAGGSGAGGSDDMVTCGGCGKTWRVGSVSDAEVALHFEQCQAGGSPPCAVSCPMCGLVWPSGSVGNLELNAHIDECLGTGVF